MQRLDTLNSMRRLLLLLQLGIDVQGKSSAEREGILEIVFLYIYVHAFLCLRSYTSNKN